MKSQIQHAIERNVTFGRGYFPVKGYDFLTPSFDEGELAVQHSLFCMDSIDGKIPYQDRINYGDRFRLLIEGGLRVPNLGAVTTVDDFCAAFDPRNTQRLGSNLGLLPGYHHSDDTRDPQLMMLLAHFLPSKAISKPHK